MMTSDEHAGGGGVSEAIDLGYFYERLEDVNLIAHGVQVFSLTAVPIGGTRRGGSCSFGDSDMAAAAATTLRDKPGFPNLRVEWSATADACNELRWGDKPPNLPGEDADADEWDAYDVACGRFYGYREDVIAAFVKRTEWP